MTKYTRKKSVSVIPRYKSVNGTLKRDGNLSGDIVFSNADIIKQDNKEYVFADDGYIYLYKKSDGTVLFDKSTVISTKVVEATKTGLDIYNSPNGKKLGRLGVDERVILNSTLTTDSNGNVWASCYYKKNGEWEAGYICYQNDRNNYANVSASSMKFNIKSSSTSSSSNSKKSTTKKRSTTTKENTVTDKVGVNAPSIVQNLSSFPKSLGKTNGSYYTYDYTLNYGGLDFDLFYKRENLSIKGIPDTEKALQNYYNRFKIAAADETLSRGFVHIFFTRPDLNFLNNAGSGYNSRVKKDPFMRYQMNTKRGVIDNLYLNNGQDHYFNLLLSNKARSFTLSDESLDTVDYGRTYHNNSITLGRSTIKSLANGTFEVSYHDDRDLDILTLHKAWIMYISNVTTGKWNPKMKYVWKKIIDYACSCYVIVTAEDFETILYWSKYYGVFPINVPYSALSWSSGDVLVKPEYSITYAYSWKEDWNPLGLTELNLCTFRNHIPKSVAYIPSYNADVGHAGQTWVGAPFVETIQFADSAASITNHSNSVMKLRFRKKDIGSRDGNVTTSII